MPNILRNKINPPKDVRPSYDGRTVVVTGANVGLGLEAAAKFVQFGAERVILGVHTVQKGEDAKSQIEARTGRKGVLDVLELYMLDYESIRKFAERAASELERLDIAVLNAGVFPAQFEVGKYGWEKTLQVNTISTALLSLLLLPKLKANTNADHHPVLELVGSGNHEYITPRTETRKSDSPLKVYNEAQGFTGFEQYSISKLFLMHVQTGLVKTLASSRQSKAPVEVVVVCPGACTSDLSRGFDQWYFTIVKAILQVLIFKPTEQGARTYISGTDLKGKGHGRFWQADKIKEPNPILVGVENEKLQTKAWEEILRTLKDDAPDATSTALQKLAADGSLP